MKYVTSDKKAFRRLFVWKILEKNIGLDVAFYFIKCS